METTQPIVARAKRDEKVKVQGEKARSHGRTGRGGKERGETYAQKNTSPTLYGKRPLSGGNDNSCLQKDRAC